MAARELGLRLSTLRDQLDPPPTPKVIERWLLKHHDFETSDESIRKAHAGETDPQQMSGDLLFGLAAFYGVPHSELGRFAEIRLNRMLAMAHRAGDAPDPSGGRDGISEQGTGLFPLNPPSPVRALALVA